MTSRPHCIDFTKGPVAAEDESRAVAARLLGEKCFCLSCCWEGSAALLRDIARMNKEAAEYCRYPHRR